ncbi:MAG: hypothetical protein MZV70_19610 [Desulfobacterales bacterium]|nr:hypothetical protein [Desulfobacterales bacterium]
MRRPDPGGRVEGEVSRAAEDAGPAVRLHPAPARHAGRTRHDAGGVGGEGDAGWQGRAGAGVMLSNVSHTTFRDIPAASAERTLLTTGSPNGVAGGVTLISVIAPSLIFEEMDIQKNKEPLQKRPLVPSPVGK